MMTFSSFPHYLILSVLVLAINVSKPIFNLSFFQLSIQFGLTYTGGIPQWSDTDVQSVVTAKTSTALWQRKRAQRCDSNGAGSIVAVLCLHCHLQLLSHLCEQQYYSIVIVTTYCCSIVCLHR